MGNLGFWEIVALAVLALLVFGPERLPGMARNVGKTVAAFRREAQSTLDDLKRAADFDDVRGLADEMKQVTAEMKAVGTELDVTGKLAKTAATGVVTPTALPAPFDSDAT